MMTNPKQTFLFAAILFFLFFCPRAYSQSSEVKDAYEQGIVYMQNDEPDKAVLEFKHAVELRPEIAEFHNLLGLAYMQSEGSVHDAIACFEEAVRLKPDLADAYNSLAIIYSGVLPDYETAVDYYKKAIEYDPKSGKSYFGLGWLYMIKLKDFDLAVPMFEKAAEINPTHAESLYYLGISYILTNQKARAVGPISKLRMAKSDDYALALTGMLEEDEENVKARLFGPENV